jgi:hypothetical protein
MVRLFAESGPIFAPSGVGKSTHNRAGLAVRFEIDAALPLFMIWAAIWQRYAQIIAETS